MSMKPTRRFGVVVLLVTIPVGAITAAGQGHFGFSGSIVFEQAPLESHSSEIDSGGGIIRAADDFILSETATIRSLLWWGGPLNIPSNGSFSATLYENASGQPGNVISDFGIGPVQEFRTGETLVGYPEFQYLAPLNQPFVAQAGVRYWLSIVQPPDYSWGWEGASPPGVSFYSIQGGAWQSADYDASFALSTDIPEPSCFSLLLCAGFAAAAYAGRHHLGRPLK